MQSVLRFMATVLLMVVVMAVRANNVQYFTIFVNGTPVTFSLAEHPVLTYSNNQLVITTANEQISIPVECINTCRLTEDVPVGISMPKADAELVAGHFVFRDLRASSIVTVYDEQGKAVAATRATEHGLASVSVAGLPKGLYIVRTESQTIKVINK